MTVNPDAWLRLLERRLGVIEARAIKRLLEGLRASEKRLGAELQGFYALNDLQRLAVAERERIARGFVEQIKRILNPFDTNDAATLTVLINESSSSGIELARVILERFEPVATVAALPVQAALSASQNAYARLQIHGETFATKASQIIVSNVISGAGIRKTTSELRAALGITARAAKIIARTESISALDSGKQAQYKASDVQYVQRLATLDTRVCPYCAARHGEVYEVGTPVVIHGSDRCVMAPWKFEWLEDGLIDLEYLKRTQSSIYSRLQGRANNGAAPFERSSGVGKPKVHWRIP